MRAAHCQLWACAYKALVSDNPALNNSRAVYSLGRLEACRSCAVRCIQLVLGVTAAGASLSCPLELSELKLNIPHPSMVNPTPTASI